MPAGVGYTHSQRSIVEIRRSKVQGRPVALREYQATSAIESVRHVQLMVGAALPFTFSNEVTPAVILESRDGGT
jgi:hypothetical protein